MLLSDKDGAMNLNLVVSIVANLKFEWFYCTTSEKSSGSIQGCLLGLILTDVDMKKGITCNFIQVL